MASPSTDARRLPRRTSWPPRTRGPSLSRDLRARAPRTPAIRNRRTAGKPARLAQFVRSARYRSQNGRTTLEPDDPFGAEDYPRFRQQFTAQWDTPARLTPTPAEATAFVREYEHARGRQFTPIEQRAATASADYLMAQVARQEHGAPPRPDDYRALLRETADTPLISWADEIADRYGVTV